MPTSDLTVLGIDPGLGRVGYGFVRRRRGELTLNDFGVIETPPHAPVGQRLQLIHGQLRVLIKRHRPHQIAVEKLFFSKNVKTALAVGEARGVVLLAAAETNTPLEEFSPQAVKLSVTGYGHADKQQVQRMIQSQFRLKRPPSPDDAADAIALAVCGTQRLKR